MFFFFKQKTAYEMRISDWSSDVCSSDLGCRACPFTTNLLQHSPRTAAVGARSAVGNVEHAPGRGGGRSARCGQRQTHDQPSGDLAGAPETDRKSVVEGRSVSVRVDLGGRRLDKTKNRKKQHQLNS